MVSEHKTDNAESVSYSGTTKRLTLAGLSSLVIFALIYAAALSLTAERQVIVSMIHASQLSDDWSPDPDQGVAVLYGNGGEVEITKPTANPTRYQQLAKEITIRARSQPGPEAIHYYDKQIPNSDRREVNSNNGQTTIGLRAGAAYFTFSPQLPSTPLFSIPYDNTISILSRRASNLPEQRSFQKTPAPQESKDLHSRIIRNGIVSALIKADDLGLKKLTILAPDFGFQARGPSSAYAHLTIDLLKKMAGDVIRTVGPSMAYIETIEIVVPDNSDLLTFDVNSFPRSDRLSLRRPISNRAEMFPTNVLTKREASSYLNTLENPPKSGETGPAYREAMDAVIAPTAVFQPSLQTLPLQFSPLWVSYILVLVGLLISFYQAQRRRQITTLHPVRLTIGTASLPIIWLLAAWVSWALPINWAPGVVPVLAWETSFWIIWLLPVIIGLVVGLTSTTSRWSGTNPQHGERDNLATRLLSDGPATDMERDDKLSMGPLVHALKNVLDHPRTKAPLVISINGPWGSGKTSVMKMVETELSKSDRFDFVWFNAWQYRSETEILRGFLNAVSEQLTGPRGLSFLLKSTCYRFWYGTMLQKLGILAITALIGLGLFVALMAIKSGISLKTLESATTGAAGGGLGIGMLVLIYRWFQPFKMPWEFLTTLGGPASELSPIDRFNRDFLHVRKVLGDRKLLVFVDDLDRCAADEVMEVLKSVNMIANAPGGSGQTFFMFGFDWQYVVGAVDDHFRDKQKDPTDSLSNGKNTTNERGEDIDSAMGQEQFGRNYLKKIITLSLSLPEPDSDRLQKLTTEKMAVAADNQQKQTPSDTASEWAPEPIRQINRWVVDHVTAFYDGFLITIVAALLAVAWGFTPTITTTENGKPDKAAANLTTAPDTTSSSKASGDPEPSQTLAKQQTDTSPGAAQTVDQAVRDPSPSEGALLVFALAALLFLVFWLLYNEKRGLARPAGDAAPSDPEELAEAISDYAKHMPKNPRDVVRLINLIRVSHAVQSAAGSRKGAEDEQENEDIFPGEAFSASESTCLALWYYKYAHLIDPEKIETMLESNGAEGLIAKLLDKSSDEKWASNLLKVSESNDDLIKALKNPDQTRRFLEIYRNLLRGA